MESAMPNREERDTAQLAAHGLLARDFLVGTLMRLGRESCSAVRVKLGAEQIQDMRYAVSALNALLEVHQDMEGGNVTYYEGEAEDDQ
jgi:hypothetical protein